MKEEQLASSQLKHVTASLREVERSAAAGHERVENVAKSLDNGGEAKKDTRIPAIALHALHARWPRPSLGQS